MVTLPFGQAYHLLLNRLRWLGRTGPRRQVRSSRPPTIELLETRTLLTGTWEPLANLAPTSIGTMWLLSDGTVMAVTGSSQGDRRALRLAPDASGSYVNGTWSQLASMRDSRLYFPSHVLPDSRLVVMGGEYGTGRNKVEIYDPFTDTWTPGLDGPLGDIGDTPSQILPDGRILVSNRTSGRNNIYDPYLNTWTPAATRLNKARANEDTWVLLPDHSILTVDIFSAPSTQKYLPDEDIWVSAGNTPYSLVEGAEVGPAHLLPDGRVFYVGANGRTAMYTPPADPHDPGSWAPSASIPDNRGVWDAPGAVLPNGKVLLTAGPHNYSGPTSVYEYDPATDSYEGVTSPSFPGPPFVGRMLMLPTGQVLYTHASSGSTQLYVYDPDGAPAPAWKPTISDITDNGGGSFLLTGTQLNGINEGAAYGDDAEMSTNYPLVRLADTSGNVFYATTVYWSETGVMTGDRPVSTYFYLPDGMAPGTYSLSVVANGIASDSVDFTVGSGQPGAAWSRAPRLASAPAPSASGLAGNLPPAPAPFDGPFPSNEPEVLSTTLADLTLATTPWGKEGGPWWGGMALFAARDQDARFAELFEAAGHSAADPSGLDGPRCPDAQALHCTAGRSPLAWEAVPAADAALDAFFASDPLGR